MTLSSSRFSSKAAARDDRAGWTCRFARCAYMASVLYDVEVGTIILFLRYSHFHGRLDIFGRSALRSPTYPFTDSRYMCIHRKGRLAQLEEKNARRRLRAHAWKAQEKGLRFVFIPRLHTFKRIFPKAFFYPLKRLIYIAGLDLAQPRCSYSRSQLFDARSRCFFPRRKTRFKLSEGTIAVFIVRILR